MRRGEDWVRDEQRSECVSNLLEVRVDDLWTEVWVGGGEEVPGDESQ